MSEVQAQNPLQRIASNFITILQNLPSQYQTETIQYVKTTLLNNGLQQIIPESFGQLVPSVTPASILSSIQKEITTGKGQQIQINQLPDLVQQTQSLIQQIPSVITRMQADVNELPLVLGAIVAVPYVQQNVLPKVIQTSSNSINQLPGVFTVDTEVLSSPLITKQ